MLSSKGLLFGAFASGLLASIGVHAEIVGRLAGEPSVSVAGAAGYLLPLPLPPGSRGLEPALAVAYDARAGSGVLGVGFRLSGFSVIHRCAHTVAQEGAAAPVRLEASDRLCLDGERLRLTAGSYGAAGSQYQTEVEQFARVTAYGSAGNGPASFTVEAADGLRYDYGGTEDSRIESLGSTTARLWALNRIRDRSGNQLTLRYTEDTQNGSHRPERIDYTALVNGTSPAWSVRFQYEARPDVRSAYFAGAQVREDRRLDRIEVQHESGAVLRYYDFDYASAAAPMRSRLVSVRACTAGGCLPATTFGWLPNATGWGPEQPTAIAASASSNAVPGDVDGDGREDLFYFDSGFGRWGLLQGTASGYSATRINSGYGKSSYQSRALAIDIDGNGRRDLLVPHDGGTWHWLRTTGGSGLAFSFSSIGVNDDAGAGNTAVADIDADGREDLVFARNAGKAIHWRRNLSSGVAPSFSAEAPLWAAPPGLQLAAEPFGNNARRYASGTRAADFNGDGRWDLLVAVNEDLCAGAAGCTPSVVSRWRVLASIGTALVTGPAIDASAEPLLADLNFDALTDVLYTSAASPNWQLAFAAGARGSVQVYMTPAAQTPVPVDASAATASVADWNADGRSDLLLNGGTLGWLSCASTGETLQSCQSTGIAATTGTVRSKIADVNGDGLADFGYSRSGWNLRLHQSGRADRLERMTDGLGHWAAFDYAETTDSLVHTAGSGAVYPARDLYAPLEVVRSLRRSDGIGGSAVFTYTYEGARIDLQGRGFLGFARRTVKDERDGVTTIDDYAQDPLQFEHLGRMTARTMRVSGLTLHRAVVTWDRILLGQGAEQRRYPYPRVRMDEDIEAGGAFANQRIRSTETQLTVDTFGTPTETSRTVTELASGTAPYSTYTQKTTLTGIVNDTGNWCLGRPAQVQSTASHSRTGGGAITRSTANTWDYVQCRLNQEITEPASTKYRVTRDYAYDAIGHRTLVTVTPIGAAARSTAVAFSPEGRFVSSVTDAEGQRTAYHFHAATGLLTSTENELGLETRHAYDAFGRRILETRPDGTSTSVELGTCAAPCPVANARLQQTITQRSASGVALRTQVRGLDELAREVFVMRETPGGAYDLGVRRYDRMGRLQQQSLPSWCCGNPSLWTSYAYDLEGRLLSVTQPPSGPNPTVLTWTWQRSGLTSTMTDPAGRNQTMRLDPLGHTAQIADGDGSTVDFDYDAAGNLLTVRDSFGGETVHSYDEGLYLSRTADPNSGTRNFQYSALGELTRITDARNQVTRFSYDKLSRRTERVRSDGTVAWTWGRSLANRNIGRLAGVSTSGYAENYAYDALGRLASASMNAGASAFTASYGYDADTGLASRLVYPASVGAAPMSLDYQYDRGRVSAIRDAEDPATVYWRGTAFDAAGRPIDEALGNGVEVLSQFNDVTGVLESRSAGQGGGTELQDLAFTWDSSGNVIERRDGNADYAEQFQYDSRERLGGVTRNGAPTLQMSYDASGNITSKSDVGNYTYDNLRRNAVVAAGSNTYAYDENGNVRRANGATINWTPGDQPRYIQHSNGNNSQFYYRPDGQRYRQTSRNGAITTETLYGLGGLFEKVTRDGAVEYRHYIVADGRRVAVHTRKANGERSTSYLLHDHLGSTDAITSDTGDLLARYSYGPFGERRASTGQPGTLTAEEWQRVQDITSRGFTGHEHLDNIGIIHMDGRVYDSTLGRFLSPDPLVSDAFDPQSFNRYSYVRNNPLSYFDPSGFIDTRTTSVCVDFCHESYSRDLGVEGSLRAFAPWATVHQSAYFGTMCLYNAYCLDGGVPRAARPNPLARPRGGDSTAGGAHGKGGTVGSELRAGTELAIRLVVPGASLAQSSIDAAAAGRYGYSAIFGVASLAESALAVLTAGNSVPAQRAANGVVDAVDSVARWIAGAISGTGIARGALGDASSVANEVPGLLVRVIPSEVASNTLGHPTSVDVFVTAADDIAGLNAEQLAARLGIPASHSFTLVQFPSPLNGIASPILRGNVGFVGGGRTMGGAREFVVPNGPIPSNARITYVDP